MSRSFITSELSRAEGVGLNELLSGVLQESEVEHWKERAAGLEIVLAVGGDEADADRVLAIEITADGKVEFAEQCDSWFGVAVTPEIAIAALEEAIAWIRANAKEPANAAVSGRDDATPEAKDDGCNASA